MARMTPRERVRTAINHEEPDRVPIVIGANNATGIKMGAYRRLKKHLGYQAEDRWMYDWPELGTACIDEKILRLLSSDVRGVLDRFPEEVYRRNRMRPEHSPFIDDWGSGQIEIRPDMWMPGVHPLAGAKIMDDIERYAHWPDMDDPYRVADMQARVKNLIENDEFAVMATPWLLFPLERAFAMQGMDVFLMNLSLDPDFAVALLKKISRLCKNLMKNFLRELGEYVDIVCIGDDLGSQKGLLLSPSMYRKLIKPIHADYISFIKERTDAKIFFHTDGDVFDLIDDFTEIGVDILNPVQTSAGRMADLDALKRQFGKRITFCGAVDTQKVLPRGTPEEVSSEIRRVMRILGPGGGYMAAAVHTIMDEVPPENICAMTDAVVRYGSYPLVC